MLLLCSGITGFQPAPTIEKSEFQHICYSLYGSNVLNFIDDGPAKNFYECIIKVNGKKVHVLLNSQYPFMAFTSNRKIEEHSFPFVDEPELVKMLEPYYKVLNSSQLNEPIRYTQKGKKITIENVNSLHQAELEQLVHWQPKTVGEVVFNYWD